MTIPQAQSMCARLCTLFPTQGTTVELSWGNSLRNIWFVLCMQ